MPYQTPTLQTPNNAANIHPGNNIQMNQAFLDGTRGINQPVYTMSTHYNNIPSPSYPHTIQYPHPVAYDPYNKRNDIHQMGGQIIPIPTPTYHQGRPIINHNQPLYVTNQMVQGPIGGQVPTPNQVMYINEGQHIIPQQIIQDNNGYQTGQLSVNPPQNPQYNSTEKHRQLNMNSNIPPMGMQQPMQSYIPPQYINNAGVISQGNNNRTVQHSGPYIIQGPNAEKEQYHHPGQLPPNNRQNPYWKDGRYQ